MICLFQYLLVLKQFAVLTFLGLYTKKYKVNCHSFSCWLQIFSLLPVPFCYALIDRV